MAEQLAPNLDIVRDGGSDKPTETTLNPRAILGDNLPVSQQNQAQPVKKATPLVAATENARSQPVVAEEVADTAALTTERLVLKILFGGSSFSIQAAMLESRRAKVRKNKRKRETPEKIMLDHARSVIGNPDQNTATAKKAA